MGKSPRLRIFAGPNGSGKSTLKESLNPAWLGFYINADDIQRAITSDGFEISGYPFTLTDAEVFSFWETAAILPEAERRNIPAIRDGRIFLDSLQASYGAAAIAELLRQKLFAARETFSFETVMSHESKVEFLREAQRCGYRTYLYFICTDDPDINIARVNARANTGGHPVPAEKIRERYYRTLDLLPAAIQGSSRAFIFDNSIDNEDRVWLAEFTDGVRVKFKVHEDDLPTWFVESAGGFLREPPSH